MEHPAEDKKRDELHVDGGGGGGSEVRVDAVVERKLPSLKV